MPRATMADTEPIVVKQVAAGVGAASLPREALDVRLWWDAAAGSYMISPLESPRRNAREHSPNAQHAAGVPQSIGLIRGQGSRWSWGESARRLEQV
jgi:hypothetical protein